MAVKRWALALAALAWMVANALLAFRLPTVRSLDLASYVLAAVSAIATLAGIGFALLGFVQLGQIERVVAAEVARQLEAVQTEWERRAVAVQEATQKIIAGYARMQQNDYQRAEALFEAAVAVDPKAFNAYTSLGYARLAANKAAGAIEAFSRAKALFPDRPEPRFDLARAWTQLGDHRMAMSELEEAIRMRPEDMESVRADPLCDALHQAFPERWARLEAMAAKRSGS
jgi:tetratricopeptide (TPR) repeat protein